jgi:uncharacterized protein YdgA (DUF945 family)
MSLGSIITLIVVVGIVWGGLTYFLIKAIKYEKKKLSDGEK